MSAPVPARISVSSSCMNRCNDDAQIGDVPVDVDRNDRCLPGHVNATHSVRFTALARAASKRSNCSAQFA